MRSSWGSAFPSWDGLRHPPPGPRAWALLVLFALGSVTAATLLFFLGLRWIEAGRAAVAATVEPVVGALLARWWVGQGLAPHGWVGLALVVAGVVGAYRETGTAGGDGPGPPAGGTAGPPGEGVGIRPGGG